jgi:hypothetical protein
LFEEGVSLFFPGVAEGLAEVGVLLGGLLEGLLLVVAEVGVLEVLAQTGVEYRELGHAVTEAETLLKGEEGQLGGLVAADVEAVLVEGLTDVAQNVRALTVLVIACERIAVKSL